MHERDKYPELLDQPLWHQYRIRLLGNLQDVDGSVGVARRWRHAELNGLVRDRGEQTPQAQLGKPRGPGLRACDLRLDGAVVPGTDGDGRHARDGLQALQPPLPAGAEGLGLLRRQGYSALAVRILLQRGFRGHHGLRRGLVRRPELLLSPPGLLGGLCGGGALAGSFGLGLLGCGPGGGGGRDRRGCGDILFDGGGAVALRQELHADGQLVPEVLGIVLLVALARPLGGGLPHGRWSRRLLIFLVALSVLGMLLLFVLFVFFVLFVQFVGWCGLGAEGERQRSAVSRVLFLVLVFLFVLVLFVLRAVLVAMVIFVLPVLLVLLVFLVLLVILVDLLLFVLLVVLMMVMVLVFLVAFVLATILAILFVFLVLFVLFGLQ
mmetsp:Transcript_27199/g.54490  ORF Transcript_27199/g.54490 Transcript_27199/m.54490 type:complete len:379 (-) Transcript_27199:198-1334(-)